MTTYPQPATPLPWDDIPDASGWIEPQNRYYIVHAVNAFPHLVAALEEILPANERGWAARKHALAIASGDVKPDFPRDETNPLGYDK
jgi:hypothetical protein